MFIRLSILLPSLITLSHAVESCINDALLQPGLELTAGLNKLNVLHVNMRAPIFDHKFQLTIHQADSLNSHSNRSTFTWFNLRSLQYNFTAMDCVGAHNAAFMEIPKYVSNGAATVIWFKHVSSKLCKLLTNNRQCKDMDPYSMLLYMYMYRGAEDPWASREQ